MQHAAVDTPLTEARARLAPVAVRPAGAADIFDGVRPQVVAEPATAEEAAAVLAWTSAERLAVAFRGGGTKLAWGGLSAPVAVLLSTARLNRNLEHRHGDLTVTVDAGTTLGALNKALAPHGQWLPLDPPWSEQATVGGLVATNDSGPRRYRHGAPRDLIIGVTLVRADGDIAKAGGIVVKNVAGYDLSRLMTGAFGSLGLIVDATFKLAPVAAATRTVLVEVDDIKAVAPMLDDLRASTLTPAAVEIAWPQTRLLVRFDSVETAVAQQAEEAVGLLAGASGNARIAEEPGEVWNEYARWWDEPGTLVKLTTLPRHVVSMLDWLERACASQPVDCAVQGRACLGVLEVRLCGPVEAQAAILTDLRAQLAPGTGAAVLRRASREVREAINPWGPLGDGGPIMRAIKERFDPQGLLNPGRGPAAGGG